MKILSIGNSFSDDAHRYLSEIARSEGVELETLNLNIGGCSLERHAGNIKTGDKVYVPEHNGKLEPTELISIQDGVAMCEWDAVTLQQVSTDSFNEESYYPYIHEIVAFIREKLPNARIYLHQTWAYEHGSPRLLEVTDGKGTAYMLNGLRHAYCRAAREINADGIIPSGELMELLRLYGANGIYRDTFHAGYGLGRYAIALLWFRFFTGRSVLDNSFSSFDEPISREDIEIVKGCVETL